MGSDMAKPGSAIKGFASSAARASLAPLPHGPGLRVHDSALMAVALVLGRIRLMR
jgi:hypothetical protein